MKIIFQPSCLRSLRFIPGFVKKKKAGLKDCGWQQQINKNMFPSYLLLINPFYLRGILSQVFL